MKRMVHKVLATLFAFAVVLCTTILPGCTVTTALRGEPGIDIGTLERGLSRSDAEAILGPPVREWTTSSNVRYRIYRYDAGVPPSKGDAVAMGFLDVISLGLVELYEATGLTDISHPSENDIRRIWRQIAISYDTDERIVGLFRDFSDLDVLPDDGRPTEP